MNAATSEPRKFSPSPRPTTSGELRRAATTRVGVLRVHRHQGERALEPTADLLHRAGEVAGLARRASSSRWAATSVSVSETQVVAVALELVAQRREVLDDAVVHDGHAALLAEVRVRVDVVGGAVRGPAGVADAGRRRGSGCLLDRLLEVGQLAGPLVRDDRAAVDEGDPGGVVAAVLQAAQTLDHDVARLLVADVPHDSAHGRQSRCCRPRLARAPASDRQSRVTRMSERRAPRARARRTSSSTATPGPRSVVAHRAAADPRGDRAGPRPRRRAGPRRGAAGLPAAVPACSACTSRPPAKLHRAHGGVPAPAASRRAPRS